MPDYNTQGSFLDSPWLQLGIPLAATAAAAIAPRHAGRAASVGLEGWQGMNQYRLGQQRMQSAFAKQHEQAQEQADFDKSIDELTVKPQDTDAPEGGQTPQADMNARTQSLESGQVPSPTAKQFSPQDNQQLKILARLDKGAAAKRMSDLFSYKADKPNYHYNDFTNEYGDQVTNRIDDAGVQTQFYRGGSPPPKPDTSVTPYESYLKGDPRAEAWQKLQREPQDSFQFLPDQQGNLYVGNKKTGSIRPASMPGGGGGQPAPTTAPTMPEPDVQSGGSTSLGGQPQEPPQAQGGPRFGRQTGTSINQGDAKAIADAIRRGEQPPDTKGLYRNAAPVRAELAKQGYNLALANLDWQATQKSLASMNSTQQLRLRQAVNNAAHQIDLIEGLVGQWQKAAPQSGFRVLNRATLSAAKNVPGETGAVAQALEAQINDLTSELANVYMGGNSPTDHSMQLAAKNLSADFNEETFRKVFPILRKNLEIRQNSISSTGVAGARPNSPYGQQPQDEMAAPTSEGGQQFSATATDKDGHKVGFNGKEWVPIP